ncbi:MULTISPECIES: hypothetical protein [unclassified Leptolyngbya]|uniref:hypothetical protein n=1 Tax=unclassified Leptolyngbya TaxID=2650499 RepID=UPI0016823050|nr:MULTISPECIES: hypothetical protein [unclassified Leptolyngbya]MBD1910631.1 hypothetical protein [Leptolyngbya sp. FACHB-8]MBD2154571.1 hypothetical protein [Leptolyngbya sp. FACHB-16]
MRRITWITLLALLTFGTTSCGGDSEPVAQSPSPDVAIAPANVPASPAAGQTTPPPPGGASPAAANGQSIPVPPPPGTLPSELIESTNPNQRLQQIQSNRADPFRSVTVQARVQPIEQPGGGGRSGGGNSAPAPLSSNNAPAPLTRQAPQRASGGTPTPGRAAQPGSRSLDRRQLAPIPDLVGSNGSSGRNSAGSSSGSGSLRAAPNLPPPPPQPTLARAVQVLGVVQVGNVPHAIVQAPNEPTSRYVRVGQRLSNGEVLVKRIEMGTEPIVVLEQVGVEVRTAVGGGAAPAAGANTTASLPLPSVPIN